MYGLSRLIDAQGASEKLPIALQQHHIELLQAVLLTVPASEWGASPALADALEMIHADLPKLADTFLYQRLPTEAEATDDTAKAILSLQERIRLSTQGVRNWGYYQDVLRISKELYTPLDTIFSQKLGFAVSELIDVAAHIVKEYERRSNEHFKVLRKVLRGRTIRQLIQLYFKYVPGLVGTPDEMLAAVPPGVQRDGVVSYIIQHFDLRLPENATFTADGIAAISACPKERVERILRALSRPPGDLATAKPQHLFLSNPVWTSPGIDLGDRFFIAIPHAVFSHIHTIVRKLAEENGLAEQLERARARYLETKLESTLRQALPTATVTAGVTWEVEGEQGETDFLAVIDRTVLIAEAKSHRLTPEGLRGAPDRMKRHIRDLVLEPSLQSARLEALIERARKDDPPAQTLTIKLGIDAPKVDRVVRLSVTLDDLSALGSAEGDFKKVGWVPIDHELAPAIHIADLICVVDILSNPILILHYLSERGHFQRAFEFHGDELDLLAFYLSTGFNVAALESYNGLLALTGASEPIDRYYEAREAGIVVPKPKPDLQPLYRAIVERLTARKPTGWTTAGIYLLNSADPTEQRTVERSLLQLRRSVRKEHHNQDHMNSLIVNPPAARKAAVIFYLFPKSKQSNSRATMESLATQLFTEGKNRRCVVFARCLDNWDTPYEICLLAQFNDLPPT